MKPFEILVERKVVNRFVITARSGAEAAVHLGSLLGSEHPWAESEETEVSRVIRSPRTIGDEPVKGPDSLLE